MNLDDRIAKLKKEDRRRAKVYDKALDKLHALQRDLRASQSRIAKQHRECEKAFFPLRELRIRLSRLQLERERERS